MDYFHNKFFGSKYNTALLLVLIFLMAFAIRFVNQTNAINLIITNPVVQKSAPAQALALGDKENLVSFSLKPGSEVNGITKYSGSVKGGYFFEGNIQIHILDMNKKVIKESHATATSEWMTSAPVSFEGQMDFSSLPKGIAFFEIHNDNASGLPENDKSILIPIVITSAPSSPMNTFTGTITALDNGCWSDGICKIQIDTKSWIIYNIGRNINHELIGSVEGDMKVGSKVEISAKKIDATNYTLVGDEKYYIKVVK